MLNRVVRRAVWKVGTQSVPRAMRRMARGAVAFVEEPQVAQLPVWREAFTGVEYMKLKASPLYYGLGVPRGNNAPVVLVPGFLGCDLYLLELYWWLRRIGYRPFLSRIGYNADCPNILIRRLLKTTERACHRTGSKVHLVGHSLGGVLARGAACVEPDLIASVVTMASPFRGVQVNPWIVESIKFVRKHVISRRECPNTDCFTPSCECEFPEMMRRYFPAHIPQTAVYTKTDGIVDWETCINHSPNTDVEVKGTHVGLAWNTHAYRVIAEHLAQTAQHLQEPVEPHAIPRESSLVPNAGLARRRAKQKTTGGKGKGQPGGTTKKPPAKKKVAARTKSSTGRSKKPSRSRKAA